MRSGMAVVVCSLLVACGSSSPSSPLGGGSLDLVGSTATTAPQSVVADGHSSLTLTVTAADVHQNPVEGATVTVSVSGDPVTLSASSGTTDSAGHATFTAMTTVAGYRGLSVTLTDGKQKQTLQSVGADFVPGPPDGPHSGVDFNPPIVHADGQEQTVATLTVRDAQGNVVRDPVDVTTTVTGSAVTFPYGTSGTTASDGTFQVTLSSTVSGDKNLHFAFSGLQVDGAIYFRPDAWRISGPDDGRVTSVVVASSSPLSLYAGTFAAGVFHSNDGEHWLQVGRVLSASQIVGLAVGESPSLLYALTDQGLERSDDGGVDWVSLSPPAPTFSFKRVMTDSSGTVYLFDGFGLVRSADHGATWSNTGAGLPSSINDFAFAGSRIYAASDSGIYTSADGLADWTALPAQPSPYWIGAIAVDPSNPARLIAGDDYGLYVSSDSGASWTQVNSGNFGGGELRVDPSNGQRIYLAYGHGLDVSANGGGQFNSFMVSYELPSFAVTAAGVVYAAADEDGYTHPVGAGIWSSTGGTVWSASSTGLSADAIDQLVIGGSTPTLYAFARHRVFANSDHGTLWSDVTGSLSDTENVDGIAADATSGTLYARAYTNSTGDEAVYRLAGGSWTQVGPSNPVTTMDGLAVNGDEVYVWGSSQFCSNSGAAASWTCHTLSGAPTISRLVIDDAETTLYAVLEYGGVLRSTDDGATWSGLVVDPSNTYGSVYDLAVDPSQPGHLAAAIGGAVAFSTDNGATFTFPPISNASNVTRVAFDPTTPTTVYAIVGGRLQKTIDGGASWLDASSGLNAQTATELVVDPVVPDDVYLGTSGAGVLVTTTGAL